MSQPVSNEARSIVYLLERGPVGAKVKGSEHAGACMRVDGGHRLRGVERITSS